MKILTLNDALVIIAAHGEYAEDGYIQEIFETERITFTGASSKTSRICIDKTSTNLLVTEIVDLPKTYTFDINNYNPGRRDNCLGNVFPVVLKPNKMGSSVYTYLIKSEEELLQKIEELKKIELKDPEFILQEYIIGVMLNSDGIAEVISITEIRPADEFFTYNSKYADSKTIEITPAEIPINLQKLLEATTLNIYNKIDPTNFYGRLDFIVKDGIPYFLEVNTLPGFSKTSIVPQQLIATGKIGLFKINLVKFTN